MRFALTGSSGMVGTELLRRLRVEGHDVTRVVRSLGDVPASERAVVWHPAEGSIEAAGLEGHDVVIHLAGESLAGIWTDAKKRRIRESRVRGTTLLARTLAGLDQPPAVLFSASGVHFYGDRSTPVDENGPAGEGFLSDVTRAWETSTLPAQEAGIRVVNTRFGVVLSPEGGLLQVMVPVFKLGLGARFGRGDQFLAWIALPEIPSAMLHVLGREDVRGPVNFVAPQHVTNRQFVETLAAVLERPALLKIPEFAARLAPGGMGEELLLGGAPVVPRILQETGYAFHHTDLRLALAELVR